MTSDNANIKVTKSWIADFVIGYSLCPFAKLSFDHNKIAYEVVDGTNTRIILEGFWACCRRMLDVTDPWISNMFLLLPDVHSYEELLQVDTVCSDFLEQSNLEHVLQTVSFHPKFCFADELATAPGHFVNRSPIPMIHILRSEEVTDAVASLVDADAVPAANKLKLEAIGTDKLTAMLNTYRP